MRVSSGVGLALLAAVCILGGCAGEGREAGGDGGGRPACTPSVDPQTVSFRNNIQPLFNRSCAVGGCHDAATRAQFLSLAPGDAYQQTVRRRSTQQPLSLVDPGDPDASYLVRKIEGTPGIAGVLMPQGCPGTPLNGAVCLGADEMQAVRTWILACAPRN
jgi:hypothetical protein